MSTIDDRNLPHLSDGRRLLVAPAQVSLHAATGGRSELRLDPPLSRFPPAGGRRPGEL